jgi:CheY-like chemotaxis protein
MQQRKRLGHILIGNGILTPISVARLLAVSKRRKKRLGWILEELGLVTGDELAGALAQQFGYAKVSNLAKRSYDQDVLNTVNATFALEHQIFPIKLEGKELALAIADPTDMKVVDNFAVNNGFRIIPFVASRMDIYEAISKFYLGKPAHGAKKTTILIVDDEALTRTALKDILVNQGYRVVIAKDGMDGFREVIANKPNVIITDKVMPKLDGFAMLKSIKKIPEFQSIPVILISSKISDEDEAQIFEMGFFDYIPKPVKEITLLSRVRRALGHLN